MFKQSLLLVAVTVGALTVFPALAGAHVTVQPSTAPADSYVRIDFRVPNESDTASTKNIKVKFPAGIYSASYQAVPDWDVTIKTRKLDKPVKMGDETLTTETDEIDFTTTGRGIEPGQFQDFGISIKTPDKVGGELKFPAVQTYSDGEVARWIGAAGSEKPAPLLTLTAAQPHGAQAGDDAAGKAGSGSSTSTVAWIALALGALGLLAGGSALASSRRRG